jgi:hypothetical protein
MIKNYLAYGLNIDAAQTGNVVGSLVSLRLVISRA